MQHYTITWTVRSPVGTELQSDTIFGHFCWALLHHKGKEALESFLNELRASPIFVLSSAFPKDYLPFPIALPITIPDFKRLREILSNSESPDGKIKFALLKKQLKKAKWLSRDYWFEHIDNFSLPGLYIDVWKNTSGVINKLYNEQSILKIKPFKEKETSITHNSINRITGTTSKGGASLYDEPVTFYEEGAAFDSYLATDYFTIEELRTLFDIIQKGGFGKKKSTGKGHYKITVQEFDPPECDSANAYLVLSNTIPAPDDPRECYYNGMTKFGKLGSNYSSTRSPFKYPLFMLTPGSVFIGEKKPAGTLMQNVHPDDDKIVQNTYCYSLPFHWKGGNNG